MLETLYALAASVVKNYTINVRRYLHEYPETRWQTERTRNYIFDQVKAMGFNPVKVESGIIVDIDVPGATEKILFRADFDALPVCENTGLPFSSRFKRSHACGHDCNAAMLLGFLKAISKGKALPKRRLRIFFQDAEENPGTDPRPESGGEVAVQEGICDGISKAYALHIWSHPGSTPGVFLSRPGAMLGNSGRIHFKVKCSGGHVGSPNTGVNALRVCNAIMNQLNTFGARHFSPIQPMTLEPSVLNAGEATNAMPSEAKMWYGFRTLLSRQEHKLMADKIVMEARSVAENMDAKITDEQVIHGHPAMFNGPKIYADTREMLEKTNESCDEMDPLLGGEDFAYIANTVPSAMFALGAHTPGSGDHHSPTFNPDESVLWKGVFFWLLLATS